MPITLDPSRPYEPLGMTTAKWQDVPVRRVSVANLVFGNDVRLLNVLSVLADGQAYQSFSGDLYPHVVKFEGRYYVSDGHTRIAASILRGHDVVEARVLER